MSVSAVQAEDFQVDDIAYNILSIPDRTVEVTFPSTFSSNHNVAYPYKHVFHIPEIVTYQGIDWKVVQIGDYAFEQTYIQEITFPSTINKICNYAFMLSSGNIQLDLEAMGVRELGSMVFFEANALTGTLRIPENVSISQEERDCSLCIMCREIQRLILPDNFEENFPALFTTAYCAELEHITLPYHIKKIGYRSANGNADIIYQSNKLQELILSNVDTIACRSLVLACNNLKRVYLGKVVIIPYSNNPDETGGQTLFYQCPNLKEIIVDCDEPEDIHEGAFTNGQYVYSTLWVPEGCTEKYRSKTGWMNFFNIKEGRPTDAKCIVHTEESDGGSLEQLNPTSLASDNVDYVKTNGKASFVITPYEGMTIESVTVNGEDVTDQLTSSPAGIRAKRIKKAPAEQSYILTVKNIKRNIDVKVNYEDDGLSVHDVKSSDSDNNIKARYNTLGIKLAKTQRGLNILQMSDGKIKKVLVK